MNFETILVEIYDFMEMLFGLFDIIILSIIILTNWYIYKYRKFTYFPWYVHLILGLSFLVILPLASSIIEYMVYINESKLTPDGFETLYIWFRWPLYWFIGLFDAVIVNLILIRNGIINAGLRK